MTTALFAHTGHPIAALWAFVAILAAVSVVVVHA